MTPSTRQRRCEAAVAQLLRESGKSFGNLSEIPLSEIRHAQRGAFPDMRMVHLADQLREQHALSPILRDLTCTRVGFQGPSPAHYIPRPLGSYDFIFIFCVEGSGWLQVNGNEWKVDQNDAFLLPEHTPHLYGADPDQPWSNYWIHFHGKQASEYAELIAPEMDNPVIHAPHSQELRHQIEQLYHRMTHVHTYSTLVSATGLLGQILGSLQLHRQASEERPKTAHENVDRTIKFMQQHLSRKLTLSELAAEASMSPNHYGSLFMKRYDNSPIDYFNRLKIQRACELLHTTDLRINEIGEKLGFQDPYYFSRLFKKVMETSPRQYR